MKTIFILASFWLIMNLGIVEAQIVKDPLRDYYDRNFAAVDFSATPDSEDPSHPLTPQSKVYYFTADFTGDKRKLVFITDDGKSLGAHGEYAWSVYCPVKSGGYQLVSTDSSFITAGLNGPDYIGYIKEIKRFGAITGTKEAVIAQYLEDGSIKTQQIDEKRGHSDAQHYPMYFGDGPPNYHMTTYTLGQLKQNYINSNSTNVIVPASK